MDQSEIFLDHCFVAKTVGRLMGDDTPSKSIQKVVGQKQTITGNRTFRSEVPVPLVRSLSYGVIQAAILNLKKNRFHPFCGEDLKNSQRT